MLVDRSFCEPMEKIAQKKDKSLETSGTTNEDLRDLIMNVNENVNHLSNQVKKEIRKPRIVNVIVNHTEPFYLPDTQYDKIKQAMKKNNISTANAIEGNRLFEPPILIDSDDDAMEILKKEPKFSANNSFTEVISEEFNVENEKSSLKIVLKEISFCAEIPKFKPPISKERLKIEMNSTKIDFDYEEPCNSNDISVNEVLFEICENENDYECAPKKQKYEIPLLNENATDDVCESSYNISRMNPFLGRIDLKRCFKSSKAFHKMMTRDCLLAPFKCLGFNCCYYSSNKENFTEHLILHGERTLTSDYFLFCAYCMFVGKNPKILVEHIETQHGANIYQCNKCFYRSCEPQSVFDHQNLYHQISEIHQCTNFFQPKNNDDLSNLNYLRISCEGTFTAYN
jgi:hypothetical protein